MGKKLISARLRNGKDDDLKKALSKLPVYYDESDIVREALRQFLFGHKGRKPKILGSKVAIDDEDVMDTNILLEEDDSISQSDLDKSLDDFIGI
ncbi:Arc/MetJ-type ribon-helix-helix transcriptional regulator [Paenibacillus jamilae]|nr:Arc/MetJ-type ribon-helix-helix transcriptional regulator [Paenibacillus jamilae]